MIFKHPTKNGWKKIKESIKEKIRQVEELQITKQELGKVIMKRIDGISNFWWKILRSTLGKLATVMQA